MQGVNKVILVGNLGADPETKFTQNSLCICNFRMVTNKTNPKTKEEKAEWHRVVAFGKLAEICGKWLTKGKLTYIEGELQTREWEDRDGNKRWTTEVLADKMVMLGGGKDNQAQPSSSSSPGAVGIPPSDQAPPADDEVPF